MSLGFEQESELRDLLDALCEDALAPELRERLESLLLADDDACRYCLDYLSLHGALSLASPSEIRAFECGGPSRKRRTADSVPAPPIVVDVSPVRQAPLFTLQSPVGSFVFSYLAGAVLLGIGLLIGWTWRVYDDRNVVQNPPRHLDGDRSPSPVPAPPSVGRITGLADCRWADPATGTFSHSPVPLGRKYALASGSMEITYDTGAKVILQGPATYDVESADGGFLSLGKLTARVEKEASVSSHELGSKGERTANPARFRGETGPATSLAPCPSFGKSEIRSPKSENSRPSTLDSRLFSVRTPTAIVTDLGTEFGVEVGKEGNTFSHVFRGSVRVRLVGGNRRQPDVVLRENESARAEKGDGAVGPRLVMHGVSADPRNFVRQMAKPTMTLDLLDIVAGGNGTGSRRERGIDPTCGFQDTSFLPQRRLGDRQFRIVPWHKLIDGVFVPDGGTRAVQLDSVGHVFDGFPHTDGMTHGSIWARAAENPFPAEIASKGARWIYAIGRGERLMPDRRGLLAFCPNAGLTVDLAAIRKTYPSARPSRFRAVAGLADPRVMAPTAKGLADIWVLVDGRLKLKRMHVRPQDDAITIDVELRPADRFLTLVSTDGGNGYVNDYVMFGDPVLEMTPTEENR
jgi:hypothetical protein